VLRSLGRHGIECWVVLTDQRTIATHSRYASASVQLPGPYEQLPEQLLAFAAEKHLDGWALLPTYDDEIDMFSAHHEQLSRRFRLGAPRRETVAWALDKRATYALAAKLGIHHPRTWAAPDISAIEDPEISYPVIVKPSFRPVGLMGRTPKAWRANGPEQLERVYRLAAAVTPPHRRLLQDLIPGGGEQQLAYAALCHEGTVLASLAAQRRRQWPLEFGNASTFVETIDENELAEPSERLLAATRFTGMIELEFKRDARDGRLALLDANPRPWGWISLGPSAGVDFSYLHWRMLEGEQIARIHARPGVRWVRMATDIPAAVAERARGTLTTRQYLRSLRPPLSCAIFAPDDPYPAIVDAPLLLAIAAKHKLERVRSGTGAARTIAPASRHPNRPRRALIIVENCPVPGDRRVWHEALSLRRAGWDVTVLAPHAWNREPEPDNEVMEGVQIRRFTLRPAEESPLSYLGEYGTAMWRIWREVRDLAKERPFDVIHACNPPDFLLLGAIGQRRRGTRLIFDHHDLAPEMWSGRSEGSGWLARCALLAMERFAFSIADVALVTNGSVARLAVERNPIAAENVFVVRNGPMLERFRPVPPDAALKRGRRHLLAYVGVMGPQDGVDHALLALSHLRRARDDWHAIFVGPGEMLPALEQLASELGLEDHVEFCGHGSDAEVRRAICSADVCLAPDPRNPYTDRSTLVKIAEYMALGRPTVSYDLAESRVTAGDAALFATNNDPAEFADRIAVLLDDPELRRRLGEIGRQRVESGLAWEHSEQALMTAYGSAIGDELLAPPVSECKSPTNTPATR
jgi:predicted ATP-grasp superfamily ATP-dependent carboligase/glycosyltransferase involved in cell wall biosynthesis